MGTATITSKGQITIPKKVREALGLKAGDRVLFLPEEDGRVYIYPIHIRGIESVYGMAAGRRPYLGWEAERAAARELAVREALDVKDS